MRGLMIEQVGELPSRVAHPPDFGAWGAYMGHGGDTYGFLSEQGIIGRRVRVRVRVRVSSRSRASSAG